jgi:hypothetical protein
VVSRAADSVARNIHLAATKHVNLTKCVEKYVDLCKISSLTNIKTTMNGKLEVQHLPGWEPHVGGAPAHALSISNNYVSDSHQDTGDGSWSFISWLHTGLVADSGIFRLSPQQYSKQQPSGAWFSIGHGDVLVINTKVLWHHTEQSECVSPGRVGKLSSEPSVWGTALFWKEAFLTGLASKVAQPVREQLLLQKPSAQKAQGMQQGQQDSCSEQQQQQQKKKKKKKKRPQPQQQQKKKQRPQQKHPQQQHQEQQPQQQEQERQQQQEQERQQRLQQRQHKAAQQLSAPQSNSSNSSSSRLPTKQAAKRQQTQSSRPAKKKK